MDALFGLMVLVAPLALLALLLVMLPLTLRILSSLLSRDCFFLLDREERSLLLLLLLLPRPSSSSTSSTFAGADDDCCDEIVLDDCDTPTAGRDGNIAADDVELLLVLIVLVAEEIF